MAACRLRRAAGMRLLAAALAAIVAMQAAQGQAPPLGFRGLLLRRRLGDKPKPLCPNTPAYVETMTPDIKNKLFELGVTQLYGVGTKGFYAAKLNLTTDALKALSEDGVEAILKRFQDAMTPMGVEVHRDIGMARTAVPNDLMWERVNTAMLQIQADKAWDTATGSSAIKVCVVDSGVEFTHPDLAANMPDQLVYNAITRQRAEPGNDQDGHGTHVSGTIGAAGNNRLGVVGVNWKVHIIGCKFLDDRGEGDVANAIECIRWCREQGARITSNSWGSDVPVDLSRIAGLYDEMKAAEDANMLFVAAAGNEGTNVDVVDLGPGDVPLASVINVGAVDSSDLRTRFTNFGKRTVHLFAPGTGITSTYKGGTYATLEGSSMACPHVTGTAALLWSFAPGATNTQIKAAIMAGVDVVPGAEESISGGRLNVVKALQALSSGTGGGGGVVLPNPSTGTPPAAAAPTPIGPAPAQPTPYGGTPPSNYWPAVGDQPADPPPAGAALPTAPAQDRAPAPNTACSDATNVANCQLWRSLGYCDATTPVVISGQLVSVMCASTCGTCEQCVDYVPNCPTWGKAGYCPLYTANGYSVKDVVCRSSCNTCHVTGDGPVTVSPFSMPELDPSGVWTTPGSPINLYIQADMEKGAGYAMWLKNPPQSLRLQSIGDERWVMTDVEGTPYLMRPGSSDSDRVADAILMGGGGNSTVWTRSTSVKYRPMAFQVKPGDTMKSLARKAGVTLESLVASNPHLSAKTADSVAYDSSTGINRAMLPGDASEGAGQYFDFSHDVFYSDKT